MSEPATKNNTFDDCDLDEVQGAMRDAYTILGIPYSTATATLSEDDLIDLFIELNKIAKRASEAEKLAKKAISSIDEDIIKYFQDKGQQKVTRRGMTVYLHRDIWPVVDREAALKCLSSDASQEDQAAALDNAKAMLLEKLSGDPETEHLVRSSYSPQSLRSWMMNDCEEDPETGLPAIPEHLIGLLAMSESYKVRSRKS